MKKSLFFYLFAVLCTMSLFTSCSDDDDTPAVSIADTVVGDYDGTLDVLLVVGGVSGGTNEPVSQTQVVSVDKAGDSTVDLRITGFKFEEYNIGNIELEGCQLVEAGNGEYKFTAVSEKDLGVLSATINADGTFSDGKLNLSLDIEDILLAGGIPVPFTVDVKYEGTKVAGN